MMNLKLKSLWQKVVKRNMTINYDSMHDFNLELSKKNSESLQKKEVNIMGFSFKITLDMIVAIIGLPLEGTTFPKMSKGS